MHKNFTFLSIIEDKFYFGFEKKIKSIINTLNSYGYISDYYNINDLSNKGLIKIYKFIRNCKSNNIIIRTIGIKSFLLLICIILEKKNKNIFIEVPTSFSTLKMEFKIKNNKNINDYIYYYLNLIFTPFLLSYFKKIIYYDTENFPFNLFIKKKIFLWQNGIDTNSVYFLKNINKIKKNSINFLCVGSLNKWHGLERLVDSIIHFQKHNHVYKFNINLVGSVDQNLKENIIKKNQYFENKNTINYFGLKKDHQLSDIFKISNIGIGSLGLKILNKYERSELKIREYTAAGLPFIMEASDMDFFEEKSFIFRVDKNNYLIDIKRLLEWFNKLEDNTPLKMRNYSINTLDYRQKVKQLINEFI